MLLLDDRVDPTVRANEPFVNACRNGHYDVVQLLIKIPRILGNGEEAIRCAIQFGQIDIVRLILANEHIDFAKVSSVALRAAEVYNKMDVLRVLLHDMRIQHAVDSRILSHATLVLKYNEPIGGRRPANVTRKKNDTSQ